MIRRQLPAHSPLSVAGIAGAALASLGGGRAGGRLRERLGEALGADEVRLVDSGTHALQAALTAVGARLPGRPVAVPAYTCFDVATAIVGAGIGVLFYDIDPRTLTPVDESLQACLDAGAGAVLAASLHGFPLDWGRIRGACDRSGALLVEDAAQGLGSGWNGRAAGSFGDLSVLSFGRGKGWTGGAGGALLGRGPRGLDACAAVATPSGGGGSLRAFAVSVAQWTLGRPGLFGLPNLVPGLHLGETRYHPPTPIGPMPRFAAAAVLRHDAAARAEGAVRRANARAWRELLRHRAGVQPCVPLDEAACGYLRFPVVAEGPALAALDGERARRHGVASGYPTALPDLGAMQRADVRCSGEVDGARILASKLRTLPTHGFVEERDRTAVAHLLEGAAGA